MLKRKSHSFMNSALNILRTFSCALDSFLEIASSLFLPLIYQLWPAVRNEFTELLFNTRSRYIESPENSRLLEEVKEPLWAIQKRTKNWFSDSWVLILAHFQSSRGPEVASKTLVLCSVSRVSVNKAYVTFWIFVHTVIPQLKAKFNNAETKKS